MYSRDLTACILAGFDQTIETLISDVDEKFETKSRR
jgi:hypothetical protein